MQQDDVCCFRVDARDAQALSEADARAVVSAMVIVRASGVEVLWSDAAN